MSSQPSKIVCVGRSYAAHAKELGNAVPEQPVLFLKPPSSLKSFAEGITWNEALGSCHYECELSLRIDQPLSHVTDTAQALQAIGAVTLGLDLTLRDLQDQLKAKGHPWERAKAFDGACMLGDWIDVAHIEAWDKVNYTLEINDELRQQGDTSLLIFSIAELLKDISQVFTLNSGDVVMTGTPAGVAALQKNDQLNMTLKGKNQDFTWTTFVK
jgi:2-keto-4-pentenoate hydratase/2-oxohepta-3-ene-1,7-dioic acid hydratase in catechol pathway